MPRSAPSRLNPLSILSLLALVAACGPAEEPLTSDSPEAESARVLMPSEVSGAYESVATEDEAGALDEAMKGEGSEQTLGSHYCCQLTWFEDPQPFQCIGYKTLKAWAVSKCAATSASIPGTYPTLASGQCSSYVFCN
jgi:hypothetical protein